VKHWQKFFLEECFRSVTEPIENPPLTAPKRSNELTTIVTALMVLLTVVDTTIFEDFVGLETGTVKHPNSGVFLNFSPYPFDHYQISSHDPVHSVDIL
jgi:hypothetical protein